MGGTSWSDSFYSERKSTRASAGTSAFAYSDTILSSTPTDEWKPHKELDPLNVVRESRDSEEHPDSNSIAVMFDVTGSMGGIPVELQKKLPSLLSLLIKEGYVEDPQIIFGAVGDATCDRIPIQIGQFESGNEMENDLEKIIIERGGGGGDRESYELAMYFFANKTSMDCLEKRGKKAYLFTIGDEMPYEFVNKDQVKNIFGDSIQENISTEDIIAKVKEKYEYFHIIPEGAYKGERNSSIHKRWIELLNQNVLFLDNPDLICEVIGLTIGLVEDNIDLEDGISHLKASGSSEDELMSVSTSLSTLDVERGVSVVGSLPVTDKVSSTTRL